MSDLLESGPWRTGVWKGGEVFRCPCSRVRPQNSVKAVLLAFILEGVRCVGLNLSFEDEVTVVSAVGGGAEGNQPSVLGGITAELGAAAQESV